MIASRGILTDIPDRLGHAVFEEQAGIISEHRVPDGRFHAHAGGASGDHEIVGVQCLEDVIQSGSNLSPAHQAIALQPSDAHQPGDLLLHLERCEQVPDVQRNA